MLAFVILCSCGKKTNNSCNNKEELIVKCTITNTPNYGRPYANRICTEQYNNQKCN